MNVRSRVQRMVQRLRKVAAKSSCDYKLGSLITNGGRILSEGFNRYRKTCSLGRSYGETESIHAEIDALRKMKREDVAGMTLYVARFMKNGSFARSKPCSGCNRAIRELGIRKVVYTHSEYPFIREEYM